MQMKTTNLLQGVSFPLNFAICKTAMILFAIK